LHDRRQIWQCWSAALHNLEISLDKGPVTCETLGELRPSPRAAPLTARVSMNTLVRAGWAVARPSKTTDYVTTEAEAKQKKLGLWQGEFMMPDAFRRAAGTFVDRS
jgi:endonuclease YncB( thermonuclease family)